MKRVVRLMAFAVGSILAVLCLAQLGRTLGPLLQRVSYGDFMGAIGYGLGSGLMITIGAFIAYKLIRFGLN